MFRHQFSSVQSLSRVRLFVTPWIAVRQASLSITNSQSLLKLVSIESVMLSNHLLLCRPLLLPLSVFPRSGSFQMSWFFSSDGQSIGISASASFLPVNIQDRFPLGWTDWISLQSKGLSRAFSNTSHSSIHTHTSVLGFSCGSAGKESACNAGDLGSIPGLGRSHGEWKGYPLQ